MMLIDTAEMYGNGRSEELIGRVIAAQRDHIFLVSKVSPNHVAGNGIAEHQDAAFGFRGGPLHRPTAAVRRNSECLPAISDRRSEPRAASGGAGRSPYRRERTAGD